MLCLPATNSISLRNSWDMGAKARTSLLLPPAAPFAYRPDRATQRSGHLWVGLSSGCPFADV